jgi:hypothetical protein
MEITMKTCSICEEEKEFNQFHKNKQNLHGLDNRCKPCRKTLASNRYKENWFHQTAILKKSYCTSNSIPFDLDAEYLEAIFTEMCPVFNLPFVMHDKTHSMSPALDRIDPGKGYVKGNVSYISSRANRIKYDASIEEMVLILKYMTHTKENTDEV